MLSQKLQNKKPHCNLYILFFGNFIWTAQVQADIRRPGLHFGVVTYSIEAIQNSLFVLGEPHHGFCADYTN